LSIRHRLAQFDWLAAAPMSFLTLTSEPLTTGTLHF
jgi:hypothetical protein